MVDEGQFGPELLLEHGEIDYEFGVGRKGLAFDHHFHRVIMAMQGFAFALIVAQGMGRSKFTAHGKAPEGLAHSFSYQCLWEAMRALAQASMSLLNWGLA